MNYAVMTFGRFQPPTKAHQEVFERVYRKAILLDGTPFIFCSTSHDSTKNPLPYEEKIQILKLIAPQWCSVVPIKDPNQALRFLASQGYDVVCMVAGDDRLTKYYDFRNYIDHPDPEKRINLKFIAYESSGSRDEDGVSATKARQFALDGDFEGFKTIVPPALTEEVAETLYTSVRRGLRLL